MPGNDTKITCPNCSHEFELSEAIVSQLKEELEKKYKFNIQEEKKKIKDSLEKELARSYSDSMTELREQIQEKEEKLSEFTENEKALDVYKRQNLPSLQSIALLMPGVLGLYPISSVLTIFLCEISITTQFDTAAAIIFPAESLARKSLSKSSFLCSCCHVSIKISSPKNGFLKISTFILVSIHAKLKLFLKSSIPKPRFSTSISAVS